MMGTTLNIFFYLVGGLFFIFPLATTWGVMMFYKRINDRETFIIQNGIRGEAKYSTENRPVLISMSFPRLNSDLL
jgi:hypothetical protein